MDATHRAAVSALPAAFASEVESLVRRLAVEAVDAALGPSAAPRPYARQMRGAAAPASSTPSSTASSSTTPTASISARGGPATGTLSAG